MSTVDAVFSDLLADAQRRFGEASCYVAAQHQTSVVGVKVPLLWAWFIGGCDVVPLQRIVGCDGRSGSFKSVLLSMEHSVWFLLAGGVAILIDTEEKTSESLLRAMLYRLPPEVRRRMIYMKAKTLEEAQQMVTFYRQKATAMLDLPEHQRFPMYIVWDSLTGSTSEASQEKIKSEGCAPGKSFSDVAGSISKYYASMVFDQSLLTVGHVQHAKKSMDPNALGDEQFVANGGDEPRFKASYHFRVTSAKDIDTPDFTGKELRMKCIKCGLGPDKRKIMLRIGWQYVWVEIPEFERDERGNPIRAIPSDDVLPAAEVQAYYEHNQQALTPNEALLLKEVLQVGSGKDAQLPRRQRMQFQQMQVEWDWSLANHLILAKYEGTLSTKEKNEICGALEFVRVGTKEVKCPELFGDDEPRSFTEFGAAIRQNPSVYERVRQSMAVNSYPDIQQVLAAAAEGKPTAKPKKKKRDE